MTTPATMSMPLPYFFVRHQVSAGTIALEYLSSSAMVADVLTKQLPATAYAFHRKTMMGHDP